MAEIKYNRDFAVKKGRVQWNTTVEGEEHLAQSHLLRRSTRKGSYSLHPGYGSSEKEIIEANYADSEFKMRMDVAIKDVCMQDKRIIGAELDKDSIIYKDETIFYKYYFTTFDGKTMPQEYLSSDYAD